MDGVEQQRGQAGETIGHKILKRAGSERGGSDPVVVANEKEGPQDLMIMVMILL